MEANSLEFENIMTMPFESLDAEWVTLRYTYCVLWNNRTMFEMLFGDGWLRGKLFTAAWRHHSGHSVGSPGQVAYRLPIAPWSELRPLRVLHSLLYWPCSNCTKAMEQLFYCTVMLTTASPWCCYRPPTAVYAVIISKVSDSAVRPFRYRLSNTIGYWTARNTRVGRPSYSHKTNSSYSTVWTRYR